MRGRFKVQVAVVAVTAAVVSGAVLAAPPASAAKAAAVPSIPAGTGTASGKATGAGYVSVTQRQTVAHATHATAFVACPAGKVPVGGGAHGEFGYVSFQQSGPQTIYWLGLPGAVQARGWLTSVYNMDSQDQTVDFTVKCTTPLSGYQVVTTFVNGHLNTASQVACPTGKVALSGGALVPGDFPESNFYYLDGSWPSGNLSAPTAWSIVAAWSPYVAPVSYTQAVVCAFPPPGYQISPITQTFPAGYREVLVATCAPGRVPYGGGVNAGGLNAGWRGAVTGSGTYSDSSTTWVGNGQVFDNNRTMTVTAICANP